MENLYYLVPAAGVIGLIVAGVFAVKVKKAGTGTERMREVSQAIQEGASAFLRAEYRVLIVFVAVMFIVIGLGLQSWLTAGRLYRNVDGDPRECADRQCCQGVGNGKSAGHGLSRRRGYGLLCCGFWIAGSKPDLSAD